MTGMYAKGRGFTLMELLMALALAAIVSSWAVPELHGLVQKARVIAATNHLLGVLQGARYRSLAIRDPVTVCGTPDGMRCDRAQGHQVVMFKDANANGVVEAEETVLLRDELLDGKEFWMVWSAFQGKDYLRWANGRTDSMNGTFTLCNSEHEDKWLRQIVLNRAGRIRLVVPADVGGKALMAARERCGG